MAEAVRLFEGIDAAVAMNSTSFANRITLSAAELGAAGFANNDEVLVLFWATLSQANTATEQVYRVAYNGSAITSGVASPRIDCWANAANTARNVGFMGRLDLATLADLTFDNQRQGTSANVHVRKARLGCIRLADFGVENTDWWWNKSTTNVAHTTTYSGTNRAAITFDAEAGEEYIVFSYAHFAVDSVSVNFEGRVMLDGSTLVAGDYSEEGESTTEERTLFCWGVLSGLSAASHTVSFESRDDTATAANDHRESALFIFKVSRFPDLLYNLGSDTSMTSGVDTQLATVTGSVATAEDALIIGNGQMAQGTITGGWMWVRDGGSTIIPPVTDDGAGTTDALWVANDNTDELNVFWMGVRALSSGAQDLDLFGNQGDGSTGSRTMLRPRLLVMPFTIDAGVTEVEGAAALSGAGDLTADGETEADGAAALGGTGDLAIAAETEADAAAALGGAGDLTADGEGIGTGAADLVGAGDLAVAAETEAEGAAAISGDGALVADAETEASGSAALGGAGDAVADAETEAEGAADLGGAGALAAAGEFEEAPVEGAADLGGAGDLTVAAETEAEGAAALGGDGTLAADAETEADAAAGLGGAGDLTISAETEAEGAADLGGAGALVADAETEAEGAAALGGEGALDVSGEGVGESAAALEGEGTLSVSGEAEAVAAADLGGAGALVADAETEAEGAAALGGEGSLAADGEVPGVDIGEAVLEGSGDLTAAAETEAEGAAGISGTGDAVAAAETEAEGAAALGGEGALVAEGETVEVDEGAAALGGAGDLAAAAETEAEGAAVLGGAGDLAAVGETQGQDAGAAVLTGEGALSVAAETEAEGSGALEGAGDVVVESETEAVGAAALGGEGSLVADGFQVGEVTLPITPEIGDIVLVPHVLDVQSEEELVVASGTHSSHGVPYRPSVSSVRRV